MNSLDITLSVASSDTFVMIDVASCESEALYAVAVVAKSGATHAVSTLRSNTGSYPVNGEPYL